MAKVVGALIAVAGGAMAVVAFAMCGEAAKEAPPRAGEQVGSFVEVTARELHAAYRANALAAGHTYRDHVLRVTGTVTAIERDFVDAPYLMLDTGDAFEQAHAHFDTDDGLAKLAPGQRVTLRCLGDNAVMGSPVLRRCAVESSLPRRGELGDEARDRADERGVERLIQQ